jgi:hypothetical protein
MMLIEAARTTPERFHPSDGGLRRVNLKPMTTEEVKALAIGTKIQIMEAIWEDMRTRFEGSDIPQWQKDLLDQRRARVRDGTARILEWDSVKATIGRA